MCKYCEKMDTAKALDFAIRDYELKNSNNDYSCGYSIDGRKYLNYMSNDSWKKFKSIMSQEHLDQFINADGGELSEKNSRWGWMPPKMASFGSSSRMLYVLSKDTAGFTFEKLMPTQVGHDANLDGYLLHDNIAAFVEAKCREIYTSHTNIDVSNNYKEVYNYLKNNISHFDYEGKKSKEQNHFKCTFKYDDKVIKHFDLKQLICHFLGITAALIKKELESKNINFIYLIFNPQKNTDFSDLTIESFNLKLKEQYEETIREVKIINVKQLFNTIMEFQSNELKLPMVKCNFDFKLLDQEEYKKYLAEVSCQTPLHS